MATRDGGTAGSTRPTMAALLRSWRERALLSQEELALRAGLSVGTVRGLEAGRVRRPHGASIRRLVQALDLTDHDHTLLTAVHNGSVAAALPTRPDLRPAQLPMATGAFVGRVDELAELDQALHDGAPTRLWLISGAPGVGKTATALHWAHRHADRFPDGQLYLDLRGYAPQQPLAPIEGLTRLLRSLGVPDDEVPAETADAEAMYRSCLAGQRVLVLLDNAAAADQVRPLLPGGPHCVALVTSRDRLTGLLVRDGAGALSLDTLTPTDAWKLLSALVNDAENRAGPAEIEELATLCGYLPLALRIAAAHLATHRRHPVSAYLDRLRTGDRLANLTVVGDRHAAVSTAFELSYNRLPAPGRTMFRSLSLVPGGEVGVPAAAALAGSTEADAASTLETLTAGHLLQEHRPGRYTFHDLIRLYAHQLTIDEDDESDRAARLARLYDFYLRGADAAARLLYPEKVRLPARLGGATPSVGLGSVTHAREWLEEELSGLVAAVREAALTGHPRLAWLLADALRGYFILRPNVVQWLATADAARSAAKSCGDDDAVVAADLSLADARTAMSEPERAIELYQRVVVGAEQRGLHAHQAAALTNLGLLYQRLGLMHEAAARYTESLALHHNRDSAVIELSNLGEVYHALGQLARAARHQAGMLLIYRRTDRPGLEGAALRELGEIRHKLGQLDHALSDLHEALALHRLMGDRRCEAQALCGIAAIHLDAGIPAVEFATEALEVAREIGNPGIEARALCVLGDIRRCNADPDRGREHYREALRIACQQRLRVAEMEALIGLIATRDGEPDEVRRWIARAHDISSHGGIRLAEADTFAAQADALLAWDEADSAETAADRALSLYLETGHRLGQARTHLTLGRIRIRRDDPSAARRHWLHSHRMFVRIGVPEADHAAALLAGWADAR